MSSSSSSEDSLPNLGSDDEGTGIVRRQSNNEFEFDVDLNDGGADAAATGLDQSFFAMLEEEEENRRQSINNNNNSVTRSNITKLPNTMSILLDPDEMIGIMEQNSVTIQHNAPPVAAVPIPTTLTLDELMGKLLNDVIMQTEINMDTYVSVMAPIIPYNSPDLQFDMSSEPLPIQNMTVTMMETVVNKTVNMIHPYKVISNIISHAKKFTYFSSLNPDWISDHIYMNFLEPNKDYTTTQLNYYKPELDNTKEWVKNIVKWKANGFSVIFNNGLSDHGYSVGPESIRIQELVFNFLVFIAIMYSYTHNAYKELGRTDLVDFWKLTLEKRQGELIDNGRITMSLRFVFKYKSSFAIVPRRIQMDQSTSLSEDEGDLVDNRTRRNRPTATKQTAPPQPVPPVIPHVQPPVHPQPVPPSVHPQPIPPPVIRPAPPAVPPVPAAPANRSLKDKIIYYTYQMEALISRIKVISAMLFMFQNKETGMLFDEMQVNQSLNEWVNKANVLLIQCQNDSNIFNGNSYLNSLYRIIESLYTKF